MPKELSPEDKALFRQAVAEIKPLKQRKRYQEKPDAVLNKKIEAMPVVAITSSLSSLYYEEVEVDTCLSYKTTSLSQKIFKELKKGEKPWQARLDLHGFRIEEAEEKLLQFLAFAEQKGYQSVLIIHGKGGKSHKKPVLKSLVAHWLKQIASVLAFYSALPRDGGTGALYILLKRGPMD